MPSPVVEKLGQIIKKQTITSPDRARALLMAAYAWVNFSSRFLQPGRFLEMMARSLELDMDQMSTRGLDRERDLTISSMCSVFAESEVISLIADNHSDNDIVHGLNKSIASKTVSMVKRARGEAPFMMTGGVARNVGVVQELESRLGDSLFITESPDLCSALGAARYAWEEQQ